FTHGLTRTAGARAIPPRLTLRSPGAVGRDFCRRVLASSLDRMSRSGGRTAGHAVRPGPARLPSRLLRHRCPTTCPTTTRSTSRPSPWTCTRWAAAGASLKPNWARWGLATCADNLGSSLALGHVLARVGAQVLLSPSARAVDADHDNAVAP